jgi:hypothetical protein
MSRQGLALTFGLVPTGLWYYIWLQSDGLDGIMVNSK